MAEMIPRMILARLRDALSATSAAGNLPDPFVPSVDPSQNPNFGDYQTNVAMVLAKQVGMNPRALAGEIVANYDGGELTDEPEIAGPGFINFRLQRSFLEARVAEILADEERLGVDPVDDRKTVVVDFSAPNVAKPMHVGHIRSTIIGDALSRIARFAGHRVVTDNHIGDWGTQFGMILCGWKRELDEEALERDPVPELLRIYRLINERQKEDDELRESCRRELVKLQAGDRENLAIWEKCVELSKAGLQGIYDQLDVSFDYWLGESFYNDRLEPLVADLMERGIARVSDGAVCVFFPEDEKLKDQPPAIIRKADGGFLYATTDLATIEYRLGELKADTIWYVVGAPQQLHFDQIFAAARLMGHDADLQFIPFGSILGKDRKMLRTRSGETVQLADVLVEAVARARVIVDEKNPDFPDEEKEEIAKAIGIGAVKYAELSQFRMTDYIFDWDTMLSLKGNTAPYLINAYVRTRAIFRKMGATFEGADSIRLTEEAECHLALKLAQYAETISMVLVDFRPNALASYIYELANAYHRFWEACPVLKSDGEVRETRLALCELTGRVLGHALGLLGIRKVEKM